MGSPAGEIALYGVVQGLTEFLPVSSSGHLALAQMLAGVKDPSLTLSVMMHAGTLGATIVMVRRRLGQAVYDGLRAVAKPSRFLSTAGGRDALVVVLASIPTAIIGLAMRDTVERWSASATIIGVGFLTTAVLLSSTFFAPVGERETPSWRGALLIGVAQAVAIVPGISRSGSTICAALWLGVKAERSFELSMLISLPAVLGAVLLEARHLEGMSGLGLAAFGASVAFVVGLIALWFLRRVVTKGRLGWFALWVVPVGVATLAMAWAMP